MAKPLQLEQQAPKPAQADDDDEDFEPEDDDDSEDDEEGHDPMENPTAAQESLKQPEADPKRVIEAALFLGNRSFTYAELSLLAKTSVRKGKSLVMSLQKEYASSSGSIEVTADANQAVMQVKPEYLPHVSSLSKNVEVTKKALRIVALISKKGKIRQSELHKYFRGDIYSYIAELKDQGYISSEKAGNTRMLKPTSKFHATFQMVGGEEEPEPVQQVLPTEEAAPVAPQG